MLVAVQRKERPGHLRTVVGVIDRLIGTLCFVSSEKAIRGGHTLDLRMAGRLANCLLLAVRSHRRKRIKEINAVIDPE